MCVCVTPIFFIAIDALRNILTQWCKSYSVTSLTTMVACRSTVSTVCTDARGLAVCSAIVYRSIVQVFHTQNSFYLFSVVCIIICNDYTYVEIAPNEELAPIVNNYNINK